MINNEPNLVVLFITGSNRSAWSQSGTCLNNEQFSLKSRDDNVILKHTNTCFFLFVKNKENVTD